MSLLKNLEEPAKSAPIKPALCDNIVYLNEKFAKCFDFKIKKTTAASHEIAYFCLDGMCDNQEIFLSITNPIAERARGVFTAETLYCEIRDKIVTNVQQEEALTIGEVIEGIIGGNLALFVDGVARAMLFSVQGYPKKGVTEPQSNMQEKGSHEGFTDSSKDNAALLRRRLATEELCMERMTIGISSKTSVVVCYMRTRVSGPQLEQVFTRLHAIKIDNVCGSGCLEPFLEQKGIHVFRGVGETERPDIFCAKLTEGKIGILVDGTPHALILPYFFIENFHSLDDYLKRPYYALFLRIVKLVSFFTGIFLPGIYVAVTMFHPEIIPAEIMYDIVTSQQQTPFPIAMESLVIHFIYEIVREAGLRMPKSVGHTVSIVGALIIGDAAVSAGLISAPMLIIVALSAITTAVVSELQDAVCVLRLVFIVLGGSLGMCSIFVGAGVLLFNLCAEESLGIPFTLPLAPFKREAMRDTILRRNWPKLSRKRYAPSAYRTDNIPNQEGSEI